MIPPATAAAVCLVLVASSTYKLLLEAPQVGPHGAAHPNGTVAKRP
jgi:hypothetical protein